MTDIYEEIWSKIKQQASQNVVFIKEGDKEILIDKERRCLVMKCKAGEFKNERIK